MDQFSGRWRVAAMRSRMAIGLLSVGLIFAACGGATTTTAPTDGGPAPTAGGSVDPGPTQATGETIDSIKVAGAGPVLTLDVNKSGDLVSVNTIILYAGNLWRHDVSGTPQPELAESLETSADGLTNTIKLKSGQVYSDGTPVTANDIKAVIDRQKAEGVNAIFLQSVASVAVTDDLTAVLTMNYPDPDILHGLSARAVALNPADRVNDEDYYLKPVSAGPYVVAEYVPNGNIRLEENPNYINGEMVVKTIEIVNVPDQTSKVLQLATGALDFVWDLPLASKDSLPAEVEQFTVRVGGANTLFLNMDPEGTAGNKFSDPRVRQAMSLAINRQEIADKAFLGLVEPLTSFWYDCGPELCPPGQLPNGGVQDVEAAKALMAEAGVERIEAEMLVSSTRGGWKEGATLVAQQLEAIGVFFTVNPVDEATWNGAVTNYNFEAVFNGGASSPQITMQSWLGDGYSALRSGYVKIPDHDKVVDLIVQMAQEIDQAKRLDLMTQVQTFARETMPMISLVERIALDGTRLPSGVIGIANTTPGYMIMQTVAEQAAGRGAGQ